MRALKVSVGGRAVLGASPPGPVITDVSTSNTTCYTVEIEFRHLEFRASTANPDGEAVELRRRWLLAMGLSEEEARELAMTEEPPPDLAAERSRLEAARRLGAAAPGYEELRGLIRKKRESGGA